MPYQLIDHTGELELRVQAETLEQLYVQAALALAEEIPKGADAGDKQSERTVELNAPDGEALLVELLNELIFLAEIEQFLPERLEVLNLEDRNIKLRMQGRKHTCIRPLVKAATYHRVAIWHDKDSWHATVVLDV